MSASLTGANILHYRVGDRLGAGGMGEVYVAEDTRLGRQVALKFLRNRDGSDPESRARLVREARAASMLRSPHIAVTYDLVEHDGAVFIAMEYVEGELISNRVARGPLPIAEAVTIASQVADALDEAHAHNVIHRDIKSANLIQTPRGLVKVLDFGLAKFGVLANGDSPLGSLANVTVTSPGLVVGTVAYMAPEQLRGGEVDHRADLFSTGVVLYEMLTARLPFAGTTMADVYDRILRQEPESVARLNYAVSPDLEMIVRKALRKEAASRYQSARELYTDLREVARQLEAAENGSGVLAARGAVERAVAVLTFANLTREPSDEWMGAGIAETVTADLKNVKGIAVIGRSQVFELLKNMPVLTTDSGDHLQAIDVGRRLGAGWVIAGAYQRVAERLRITAHLVEVPTGALVRTLKLDGRVDEIFELQDRIVFDLSRGLDVKLDKDEADAIERDETKSVEAFEAYSRGVVNMRLAGRDAIDRAIALFERATELDPDYAVAWAALGGAYSLKATFLSLTALHQRALGYLRRAIALKPRLANAHRWLGGALLGLGQVDEGVAALRAAADLEPDNPDLHQALARAYWMWRGLVPEGIAELLKAIARNPEAGYAHLQLSFLEALSGNLDSAEASARRAIDLQERAISGTEGLLIVGAHARLGYVFYLRQRYDEAYAEYRRELEYLSTSDHALRERTLIELHQKLGAVSRARGDREQAARFGDLAVQAHARRVAAGADDPATRYYVAAVYAGRGDAEGAQGHLALPLSRLPQFTRWRVPRDVDFEPVRSRLSL